MGRRSSQGTAVGQPGPPAGMNSSADMNSTLNVAVVSHSMMSADDLSDPPSSPESPFDDSDLLSSSTVADDVTAQLAAAGPVGVAAAAAIATGKKRKRPHTFETNPSIRKRQQTRLLRSLKATIDEYTTRVGQQAVVLAVTPGKPQNHFKVFGAHPLETVVRACRGVLVGELEAALAQQAPPQAQDDPTLHELPPVVMDGIPTPIEKMTQAQLRTFIPLMLKYSTGRGKPGWGKESTRPLWWPSDLPWANVRSDVRSEEDKQKVSWTHALRQIVINCYRYHGREDLLPAFEEDDKDKLKGQGGAGQTLYTSPITHYTPTMVQTINNPDGTVSIIHVDPGSALLTLPDGTQAQVRTINAVSTPPKPSRTRRANQSSCRAGRLGAQSQGAGRPPRGRAGPVRRNDGLAGQAVTPISTVNMELNSEAAAQAVATLAEATINHDGQIILTGEDGTQSGTWDALVEAAQSSSPVSFPVSGMVTIPVSMYHGMQVTMAPVVSAEAASSDGTGETVEVLAVPVSTTQQQVD
ncbi:nuclear respiratory factor, putative [Ixodes scapularis]|uniref:Nuclear respiratory factor, putative n=1 Tax=Ixodes scapularis TaxID=6945 RepID=B7QFX3_IXOSC|nr:nuclear respiratory factor, putative [Ixodes scapularis]|eukprot:XP_002401036.1 nuclear respiratory factor, putative [Ixodes scapularis]